MPRTQARSQAAGPCAAVVPTAMAPSTATSPKILFSILNLPSITFCVEIMSQFTKRLPRLHRFALQGLGFPLLVTGFDYAQCADGLLLRIGERSSTTFDENESDPEISIQRPVLDLSLIHISEPTGQ